MNGPSTKLSARTTATIAISPPSTANGTPVMNSTATPATISAGFGSCLRLRGAGGR